MEECTKQKSEIHEAKRSISKSKCNSALEKYRQRKTKTHASDANEDMQQAVTHRREARDKEEMEKH